MSSVRSPILTVNDAPNVTGFVASVEPTSDGAFEIASALDFAHRVVQERRFVDFEQSLEIGAPPRRIIEPAEDPGA